MRVISKSNRVKTIELEFQHVDCQKAFLESIWSFIREVITMINIQIYSSSNGTLITRSTCIMYQSLIQYQRLEHSTSFLEGLFNVLFFLVITDITYMYTQKREDWVNE